MGEAVLRYPITGIAFCCARRWSGHMVITPARDVMKSRRLMSGPLELAAKRELWLNKATSDTPD